MRRNTGGGIVTRRGTSQSARRMHLACTRAPRNTPTQRPRSHNRNDGALGSVVHGFGGQGQVMYSPAYAQGWPQATCHSPHTMLANVSRRILVFAANRFYAAPAAALARQLRTLAAPCVSSPRLPALATTTWCTCRTEHEAAAASGASEGGAVVPAQVVRGPVQSAQPATSNVRSAAPNVRSAHRQRRVWFGVGSGPN
ncbi:hypothetical protein GGX14DRAFT_389276 [Mycena pura]|uniref:Uncharacterized protein n=1 Tax=Mycena pura TaxID=153505 RepID=A0AAD6VX35_9AGAR|nr:hypothetical protein GGX14DRAFT_389276 [Mycena pura]